MLSRTGEREIRVLIDAKREISVHSRGAGETGVDAERSRRRQDRPADTPAHEDPAHQDPRAPGLSPRGRPQARSPCPPTTSPPGRRRTDRRSVAPDTLFADVRLPAPDPDAADPGRRVLIHPALLHAALRPADPGRPAPAPGRGPGCRSGARASAYDPPTGRPRCASGSHPRRGHRVRDLADEHGTPVGGVASLDLRPWTRNSSPS
ncbi:hypothetical protein [Streptomyces sp. KL116D]|uniref:hypothetical protein n=1 Tax=Streptomyces sp. KL116D TaxID=3045152 RepID=UPI003558B1EF